MALWLSDPTVRRERELAAFGCFGHDGRELVDRLAIPDPWRSNSTSAWR